MICFFNKRFLCGLLAAIFAFFPGVAHADLGFWSAALVGNFRHPSNGDHYRFNSNATYTFTAGAVKRRGGNVSHSGFWKIVDPTPAESGGSMEGPVALRLRSTSRVVLQGGRRRTLSTNRVFRVVVDTAAGGEENAFQSDYYIGGVRWRRVR